MGAFEINPLYQFGKNATEIVALVWYVAVNCKSLMDYNL